MELQTTLGLSVLVGLTGLSWWLLSSVEEPEYHEPERRHAPDAWLVKATTTAFDAQGNPHYTVVSDRQDHFRDDDTSEHINPVITSFREVGPPWNIESDHAWVAAGGDLVLMKGHVFMNRQRWLDADGKIVEYREMTTRDLLIRPNDDYVETDEEVFMVSDSARINAIGMRAYLDVDRVQFLNRVRSRHANSGEPPKLDAPRPASPLVRETYYEKD